MPSLRLAFLTIAAWTMSALSSWAASESTNYVVCENGAVCAMQPCPSYDALNLDTGEIVEVVAIDTTRLPWRDRARKDLSDSVNAGKIVVKGSIEHPANSSRGDDRLIATSIERASKKSESKHCLQPQ